MKKMDGLQQKRDEGIRRVTKRQYYLLKDAQVLHIIKKLLQMPTHLDPKQEIETVLEILKAFGFTKLRGELETIFREDGK